MPLSRSRTAPLSLLLVVLLMLASSAWLASLVGEYDQLQMDLDEANKATRGLDFASALRRGNLSDVVSCIVRIDWYPPGHGVFLGTWFLCLGPEVRTARLYSTLHYCLLGVLLWGCTRSVIPGAGPVTWLVPTLFLMSDPLYLMYSCLSMLELPAVTFSVASLFFLNRAVSGVLLHHGLAALFGVCSFFVKYNYGLVTLSVLVICLLGRCVLCRDDQARVREIQTLLPVWIPTLTLLLVWLVGLGQWRSVKAYASAQPVQEQLMSIGNLAYYPELLWHEGTNWLAVLLVPVAILGWKIDWQGTSKLIPHMVFFGIGLAMLTYTLQNNPRFGMMLFPPLWLISVAGLAWLDSLSGRWCRRGTVSAALVLFLAVSAVQAHLSLSPQLREEYENTHTEVHTAYEFIADTVGIETRRNTRIAMFGYADQWNAHALRFFLESTCLDAIGSCVVTVVDDAEIKRNRSRRKFSLPEQARQDKTMTVNADFVVTFATTFHHAGRWRHIASRTFTFQRSGEQSTEVEVTIYRRGR